MIVQFQRGDLWGNAALELFMDGKASWKIDNSVDNNLPVSPDQGMIVRFILN
jgi:hypothetical protein